MALGRAKRSALRGRVLPGVGLRHELRVAAGRVGVDPCRVSAASEPRRGDQRKRCDQRRGQFHQDRFRQSRSEEHTAELQSLMRISYAVFRLKKKKTTTTIK